MVVMNLKVVQLNLYKGKWLEEASSFLKGQDADLITLQEVSVGDVSYYRDKNVNQFDFLKKELGLFGVFHASIEFLDSSNSVFGNAVLSKFEIVEHKVIPFCTFRPVTLDEFSNNTGDVWSKLPRHILDATLNVNGHNVHTMSLHARRTVKPVDSEESLKHSRILVEHIKSLSDEPFIVGGDFNLPPETQFIKNVEQVACNLVDPAKFKQTLNSRRHFLKDDGFVIDYIFTSKQFVARKVDVPDVDISDHLPVVAELEFVKS